MSVCFENCVQLKMMSRYDKDRVIGTGTFGNVWLVKSKLSRHSYIIKEINLFPLSEVERESAMTEVAVLSKLKHKNIVRYKEASIENKVLSIVMEYAEGGDLYTAIAKQNGVPFPEQRIISWFIHICLALQYIHFQRILHRDLKSQNIFLTRNKIAKVGDFGISRVLRRPDDLASTAIGTPYYLSPELCQRKPYSYKSDVWALGCVLFEMSALCQAFKAEDFLHLVNLIIKGQRRELPRYCSGLLHDLVEDLLTIDHEKRPSTREILEKPELQPYLSEYLAADTRESRVPVLVGPNPIQIPNENSQTPRGSSSRPRDLQEASVKRKASLSEMNTNGTKRFGATVNKQEQTKLGPSCNLADSRQRSKPPTLEHGKLKRKLQVTFSLANLRYKPRMKKTENFLTVSCDTYTAVPSTSADNNLTYMTKSDDAVLNAEADCGYGSAEVKLGNSNRSTGANGIYFPNPCSSERNFKAGHCSPDTDDVFSLNPCSSTSNCFPQTGSFSIGVNREQASNKFTHNHCEHPQCHQCMLDTLWKNRIRGSVGSAVNAEEYSRLKKKLLLVYKDELFRKVHQSLTYDWETNNVNPSKRSILDLMNTLNYEQVQNLPLMMQLIQLDMLMNSKS